MHNKMQKKVSHLLFLKSIGKRGGGAKCMNKWEVDEHKQWSEKMRSRRFCPYMLNKNRNYERIK